MESMTVIMKSYQIKRMTLLFMLLAFSILGAEGRDNMIVVDSLTRRPLPGASVFDRTGMAIGISNNKGCLPHISQESYPLTLRYLGYKERTIPMITDTVSLIEQASDLPEVIVESTRHKVLHVLAYVREYSNLTTYTDTIFLFREKMVDYMLTPDKKVHFSGWSNPRVLKSQSYYRFTNSAGLDSVSSKCNQHFSWSDWVGIASGHLMPKSIIGRWNATDTIRGKYSPTEIWIKNGDRLTVNVNVLADTASRKWVPNLSAFFKKRLDFENFRATFNYDNVAGDSVTVTDLTGYSFNIESNGRGYDMFRFNRKNEPFFVNTFAEVYILDKEYITVKEAKKWANDKFDSDNIAIIEPAEAPEIQEPIQTLIARVNAIDHKDTRLNFTPDHRLAGRYVHRQSIGQRALFLLRQLTGITYYKSHKNFNNHWNEMKNNQFEKNRAVNKSEERD